MCDLLGAALQAAATNCGPGASLDQVLGTAWTLYGRITHPPVKLGVTVTIARKGEVRAVYQFDTAPEEGFMTAITMDDTATVAVAETDDHNDPVSDTLTWVGSDGGTVLTLTPSADTKSCVVTPIAEGAGVTVTCSDPAAPQVQPFVAEFDIGPGPASSLTGTVVVNTGANAVPPSPPAP